MFIATVIFWLGRRHYVRVPPSPPHPDSFLRVVRTALFAAAPAPGRPGLVLAGIGGRLALAFVVAGLRRSGPHAADA